MQQGIVNNPDLAAAQAALRVAQQNLRAGQGALFPSADLSASATRQRTSGADFGAPTGSSATFNVYNVTANVSYTLDLFGGVRRQIEALGAQVDFQNFEGWATYLTLTTNIVTTAITEASLRAQIEATYLLIGEQKKILNILKQQMQLGGIAGGDVLTQETQLAQTRATLPPLQKNFAQNRDALAALVGGLPANTDLPALKLSELTLPKNIPLSVPSYLVCQRPDIRASEALLHAASAQIGVATANLLPQITLNASYGWAGTSLSDLFTANDVIWSYGAQLLQPIFRGGTLVAQRRGAIAAFDQAAAQYRATVLVAFRNVADSLNALIIDANDLRAKAQAENSAYANFRLVTAQYRLGGVNFLNLLNAEFQYQQTRIERIKSEAARYADTAALFQALGGGWWQTQYLKCPRCSC